MFPIGFSYLGEYLERHGVSAHVVNLATRMLEKPGFNVESFISRRRPLAFGIGLHWLPHCHGAIEVARICKSLHPDVPVVMGGYSATFYHRELMDYPEVDYILRGDSTEEPLLSLVRAIESGSSVAGIPNLTYRDEVTGETVDNPVDFVPEDLDYLGDNYLYMLRCSLRYGDLWGFRAFRGWWSHPTMAVLTVRGCRYDCGFCGGSKRSASGYLGRRRPAFRSPGRVASDIQTIASITTAPIFVIGDIRQNGDSYARELLAAISRISPPNHVVLELFRPAGREFFDRVRSSLPSFSLEISPHSHDETIRQATGNCYANADLESTLRIGLDAGAHKFDVFFMVGLPCQTPGSVMDSIDYCDELLGRYGTGLNPLVGPLAPFLDPGCIFREEADRSGYRVLFDSLAEHRSAMLEPNWRDMLDYQTRWMTRQQITSTTYRALLKLNRVKARHGQVSADHMIRMESYLESCISLAGRLDEARLQGKEQRGAEMERIAKEADRLLNDNLLVKSEIQWPVAGRRFRYLNIARLLLSGGREGKKRGVQRGGAGR